MKACDCSTCPAFRRECEGCTEPCRYRECDGECARCPVRCGRRDDPLATHPSAPLGTGGTSLALDMPLASQPLFDLPPFFPQLLNGLEVPSLLARESLVAVGIAKALTPRGQVSRRATPVRYGPRSLRAQWGIGEDTRLVCVGNYLDPYLERLWAARSGERIWGVFRR